LHHYGESLLKQDDTTSKQKFTPWLLKQMLNIDRGMLEPELASQFYFVTDIGTLAISMECKFDCDIHYVERLKLSKYSEKALEFLLKTPRFICNYDYPVSVTVCKVANP
jgi:hypothetical protein